MPIFSRKSKTILSTCDARLRRLFDIVIKEVDCTVFSGHRDQDEQNELQRMGRSKLKFPHSSHNENPSRAVDVAPWPIVWNDRERATYFAGFVKGIAYSKGIPIRWGGDWDGDWEVRDNIFDDLWHFELIGND